MTTDTTIQMQLSSLRKTESEIIVNINNANALAAAKRDEAIKLNGRLDVVRELITIGERGIAEQQAAAAKAAETAPAPVLVEEAPKTEQPKA